MPVDLGRFSGLGRAMRARVEMVAVVKEFLEQKHGESGHVIADLAAGSAEDGGEGFSEMEIVDTVLTLLFASVFTTAESLPPLLVELSRRPEWRARIAAEPLEFDQ